MSVELAVELLGSQLVHAVASEVAISLAGQAVEHLILSAVNRRPTALEALPPSAGTDARPRLHVLPTVEVLSSVPGRARLRIQGLRGDPARGEELAGRACALPGVHAAEPNALTGSLLVRFDPRLSNLETIVAALEPRRAPDRTRPHRSERTVRLVTRESA